MKWKLDNVYYVLITIPLTEVHQLFSRNYTRLDVFLFEDREVDIQWLIKDIGTNLADVSIAYLLYSLTHRVKTLNIVCLAYFWLQVFGAVNYFIRMNTDGYFTIYLFFILFTFFRIYKPTV